MWLVLATAFAGSEGWVLADESWIVDEPVEIARELSSFDLDRGYVFRIEDAGEPVGAVFVGSGTWEIAFETSTDAIVAANRMVVLEGADPEPLRPVVRGGQALPVAVDRGWMVGVDVWDRLEPRLMQVEAHGGALYGSRDGIDEVIVTGDMRLARARKIADEALRERALWMRTYLFDPDSLVEVDGWDGKAESLFADFRTDRSWDRYTGVSTPGADLRWLSYVHEPHGALLQDRHTQVFAALHSDRGVDLEAVAVGRFDAASDGRRRAPVRFDLEQAAARHTFRIEPGARAAVKESWTDLAVRAVGGEQQVVWVDVPHTQQEGFQSEYPLHHGWELLGITLADGTPLEAVHLPLSGSQSEGRGSMRTFAVRLPASLKAGETATVRVGWRDRHRYGRWFFVELNGVDQAFDLGSNTNLLAALPRVRGDGGVAFRAEIEAGIQKMGHHDVVVSGDSEERWSDDHGLSWVRSVSHSRQAVLAAGIWDVHTLSGDPRYPAIQTALRERSKADAKDLALNIRKLLALYQQVFPDYPAERIQMMELISRIGELKTHSADRGAIGLGSWEEFAVGRPYEAFIRDRYPHFEERGIASALAMHWFAGRGLAGDELAAAEVVGPAMGIAAIGALYGDEPADQWLDVMRECARPEDRVVGPVSRAGRNGRCAGIHLFGRGLPARIGQPAVNAALASVFRGEHAPTFDGLRAALEATSGQDLAGVFEPFVHGAVAPDVEVVWSHDGQMLRGTATTNLAFGALDVPVRIEADGASEDGWIRLIDGTALFEIPWTGPAPTSVRVDPDDVMLFRHVTSVQGAVPMA